MSEEARFIPYDAMREEMEREARQKADSYERALADSLSLVQTSRTKYAVLQRGSIHVARDVIIHRLISKPLSFHQAVAALMEIRGMTNPYGLCDDNGSTTTAPSAGVNGSNDVSQQAKNYGDGAIFASNAAGADTARTG